MREGVNPEKFKAEENREYLHRVIIPVYIPNTSEPYYQEALEILERCLYSLTETINTRTTAITIINNSSCAAAGIVLETLNSNGKVDKFIRYQENKGKVYAVVNEAKASFEEFITITDADVMFLPGWEVAVFELFREFPRAGVVAPLPSQNNAFYFNSSVFFGNYFSSTLKYDQVVDEKDSDLFLKGLGNESLHDRNNRKFSWKEKQYYLKKDRLAIIGAGHFVATYRRSIFDRGFAFPKVKFRNGLEEEYLDKPADRKGMYRLSTPTTFAYHMGNRMDAFSRSFRFDSTARVEENLIREIPAPSRASTPFWIRDLFFRGLKKIKKL